MKREQCDDHARTGVVGILFVEKWVEKMFHVNHVSDHILLLKVVGETITHCPFCISSTVRT